MQKNSTDEISNIFNSFNFFSSVHTQKIAITYEKVSNSI